MPENSLRFVKSYPDLMNSTLWHDDAVFKLYHYFLYRANRSKTEWLDVELNVNEALISQRHASEQLHWSIHKLQRQMKALQSLGAISVRGCDYGTIVTVLDFNICSADGKQYAAIPAPYRVNGDPSQEGTEATDCGHDSPTPVATTATPRSHSCITPVSMTAPCIEENKKKEYIRKTAVKKRSPPTGFETLWDAYPEHRQTRWDEAINNYEAAVKQGATLAVLMKTLEEAKQSYDWVKENGQYVPSIATWLQRKTWKKHMKPEESEDEEW